MIAQQVELICNGNIRTIARAISRVENEHPEKEALIDALYPYCGHAVVWGITGPPGAGKSSLLEKMIARQRKAGKKVAVIAIDPSSPFTGGAILGDRLRMQKHSIDPGVFIRSMASRGHLGGVAGATSDAIKVLDAAGYDVIFIETIGVGQTEIEVMELSDVVLLVLVPGLGDEIQALKAGVMEIGDVFVINKCDRDDAMKVQAEVEYVLGIKYAANPEEMNPVKMTSALNNEGIYELITATEEYLSQRRTSGLFDKNRKRRIKNEVEQIIEGKIRQQLSQHVSFTEMDGWVEQLFQRKKPPYALINQKLNAFLSHKFQ
ncbi:methylmalonyl Co-A mutase-associated GTPase MeaB [bacterium]|nr:methylmalonyl Co-A mutase-associated GTPase MeaB [bacterium]